MRVLIACEESQAVCLAFRSLGHESYSCDLQECSGGHPEYHLQNDCLSVIYGVPGTFHTQDGKPVYIGHWDMIISHPPCTYLTFAATQCHSLKCYDLYSINERTLKRIEAMQFFMSIASAPCAHIAIENPRGIMNTAYRKPDQIIEPCFFADSSADLDNYVTKTTCLWLKNLPLLRCKSYSDSSKGIFPLFGDVIEHPDNYTAFGIKPDGRPYTWTEKFSRSAKIRSKTFPGIASAMAAQWGVI